MTKAANRKRKHRQRGRPIDPDCEREPNGRKSRALRMRQFEPDAREVGIAARQRVLGIAPDLAGLQDAGSVLGLLCLQKRISPTLKEAGDRLEEYHHAFIGAIQAPDTLAAGGTGGSGEISDDYVDWAEAAIKNWDNARKWLRACGAFAVFERVVIGRTYPDIFDLTLLRRALAYSARQLGLDKAA